MATLGRRPDRPRSPSTPPPDRWSDIAAIRREWPAAQLDADRDLWSWRKGCELYARDDYPSMMRCATLLSTALAHNLHGPGILRGRDLPQTIHKVLYASVEPAPDGRTFAVSAQRCVRLALTIVRENGWHPEPMGGRGVFDLFILDKAKAMRYSSAVAGEDEVVGDLRAFFAVPPEHPVMLAPAPELETRVSVETPADRANALRTRGLASWTSGDLTSALADLEQAAELGDVRAVGHAAAVASEAGRDDRARFWFERSASAGDAHAMFNLGTLAVRAGDAGAAAAWFQRAADAGDPDGYAGLAKLAGERGDRAEEQRWAGLGAEAGQSYCLFRHGLHLTREANGDSGKLRRAAGFLEAAAGRGDVDGMLLAADVNRQLGNHDRSRMWCERARSTGHPNALATLEELGL